MRKPRTLIGMIDVLIGSVKSRSERGASHQPAFMSSRQTTSHTFYLPYLPSTLDGVTINRKFWNVVKPFLTSKGFLHNYKILININGNIVKDEQKLTKEFNSYYINIVKTTSG